jgi:bacteriocin-like protein
MKKLDEKQMEQIEGGLNSQKALQIANCLGMVVGAVTGDPILFLAGWWGC